MPQIGAAGSFQTTSCRGACKTSEGRFVFSPRNHNSTCRRNLTPPWQGHHLIALRRRKTVLGSMKDFF
jgi:hypothetical protein